MQTKKSHKLHLITILLTIVLSSCDKCPQDEKDINYGYYRSVLVDDDYIQLLPNNEYVHKIKRLNYEKPGKWIKGENCKIYLEQFSQVINKFDTTEVDSSRIGSYSFFLTNEGLETPESYEGYEYVGKDLK